MRSDTSVRPSSSILPNQPFASWRGFQFFPQYAPTLESTDTEVLEIFTRTGALLKGHFVLRSGLHSGHFFQCAKVGENLKEVTRLAELLVEKLGDVPFDTVLAPAMGGLVMGQEVARQTESRYIFAEKVDDRLVLRRGFKLRPGEKILVVEDVVTRGGRVKECIDIIAASPAECVGIAMLVDRSGGQRTIDVPVTSLLKLTFPTYSPDQLPPELAATPVEKPGS
jgi:orotate phosphoribosyltransferase